MVDSLSSLKDILCDLGFENSVVLESPDYVSAVVGVSVDGQVIFDYARMIEHLVTVDGMAEDEAAEFIDYNTIRAIPYMGSCAPIIQYIQL